MFHCCRIVLVPSVVPFPSVRVCACVRVCMYMYMYMYMYIVHARLHIIFICSFVFCIDTCTCTCMYTTFLQNSTIYTTIKIIWEGGQAVDTGIWAHRDLGHISPPLFKPSLIALDHKLLHSSACTSRDIIQLNFILVTKVQRSDTFYNIRDSILSIEVQRADTCTMYALETSVSEITLTTRADRIMGRR